MEEEYYTARTFAKKLGVKRQTVYKWIKEGRLQAEERNIGGFTLLLIPRDVADKFEMPTQGRPKKI